MLPRCSIQQSSHLISRAKKIFESVAKACFPRLWAGTLTAWLLSYGFVAASSTDCLFILHAGAAYIYLAYWVDDMLRAR